MDEWESKLEKMALSMMNENVASLAGVPSWMMVLLKRILEKKNVSVFNKDVAENKGYRYTNNAPFSSQVANLRQTQETLKLIPASAKTIVDIGCGDGTYTIELAEARPDLKFAGSARQPDLAAVSMYILWSLVYAP
jgi:2-polyprenyl-3-methyl-5-hydroxy-6-metoxy-1,4-benzoquinol methylase